MTPLSTKILRGTARAEREASVGSITTKILSGTISTENLLIKKLHKNKKMDKKSTNHPKEMLLVCWEIMKKVRQT